MSIATSCAAMIGLAIFQTGAASPDRDYPVRPVPFTSVEITGGFWAPRLETNRRVTVPAVLRKCEETGRIANFARAGKLEPGGFRGRPYDDSDVFKAIEGASYSLALRPDPQLASTLDAIIRKVAAAQEPDGYLYTARTLGVNDDFTGPTRWSNLRQSHELYNAGHLYEAAVAHSQATGRHELLDIARRNADLICRTFGPGAAQRHDVPGHEEIEIGLVKLYRATGEARYLQLARYFVDQRGREAGRGSRYGEYAQDHAPLIEQREAVGHAVRAGYFYAGVADIAALTGEPGYAAAIDRLWQDIVSRKMHLTGGIGARRDGEAFGGAYDLPNESAYLETCAAIANALFNYRMFLLHGDGRYIDVLERVLYNGFLSGVGWSGDVFFYPNPLACDGRTPFNQGTLGRAAWFNCACCPVNVVRFLPSIPGFAYAVQGDSVFVNLYAAGRAKIDVAGQTVRLTQETDYPWDGRIRLRVEPAHSAAFAIRLRIPDWVEGRPVPSDLYRYLDASKQPWTLTCNGQRLSTDVVSGYATVQRTWSAGDTIELNLPMAIRRVVANERVAADRGRVALERGPIVYCVEACDHGGHVSQLVLPDSARLTSGWLAGLTGGVVALNGDAIATRIGPKGDIVQERVRLTAIPYFAWAHRQVGEMAVWLPREVGVARPIPRPTLASTATVSASHTWQSDTAAAVNDQVEPRSSNDATIPRFTWWDHHGTNEWVVLSWPRPTQVRAVSVYWFDDAERGACRVPKRWRVLYRAGENWRPVVGASAAGVARDGYNPCTFEPVQTDALRIEVELRAGFSGGILELKID